MKVHCKSLVSAVTKKSQLLHSENEDTSTEFSKYEGGSLYQVQLIIKRIWAQTLVITDTAISGY
jgi:hypothetical protein